MRMVRKGILFILGLGFTVGLVAQLAAAPFTPPNYPSEIEPVSYDPVSGRAVIEAKVRCSLAHPEQAPCMGLVTVRIDELDGLVYTGPETREVRVDPSAPAVFTFELIVPANDTSGLDFTLECGTYSWRYSRYFVTSGDSIKGVWSDPRHWIGVGDPPTDEERNRFRRAEFRRLVAEKKEREAERAANPQSAMKITTRRTIKPCDSALFDSLSDLGQSRLLSMRARERDAYEGSARQLYEVEGRWWVRERGEREFRRLEPQTDEELHEEARRLWDSLGTKSPDDPCTAYVFVKSPDDEAFARSLIDRLSPTDQLGVYRVHTTHRVLEKLRAQGIRYRFNLRRPRDRRDSTSTP